MIYQLLADNVQIDSKDKCDVNDENCHNNNNNN